MRMNSRADKLVARVLVTAVLFGVAYIAAQFVHDVRFGFTAGQLSTRISNRMQPCINALLAAELEKAQAGIHLLPPGVVDEEKLSTAVAEKATSECWERFGQTVQREEARLEEESRHEWWRDFTRATVRHLR